MDKNFYRSVVPDTVHDKISESIIAMMATGNLPYYGEFALFINFHEVKRNPHVKTAGVNVTPTGMNFYWDRSFFDSLAQPQSNFLLLHEEFHLLFDHLKRSVGYDQRMANVAQDMIINQIIHDEIMKQQGLGNGNKPFIEIPKDYFKKNSALFIPKEYKGEPIFEELYEWLQNKRREWQEKNKEAIKKMREEGNKCPKCGAPLDQNGNDANPQQQQPNQPPQNGQPKPDDKKEQDKDKKNSKGQPDKNGQPKDDDDDQECDHGQPSDKGQKGKDGNGDQGDHGDGDGEGKDKGKGKGKGSQGEGEDGDGEGEGKGNHQCDHGHDGEGEGEGKGKGKGEGDGDGDGDGQGQGQGQGGQGSGTDTGDGNQGGGQNNPHQCPNCGHENADNRSRVGEKDTSGNPKYGQYGKNNVDMYSLDTIFEGEEREEQNTLDSHLPDEIPAELKKEIVDNVMQRLKNRGLQSGDVETILNKLRKTKKDYLKEIKRTMSNHVFGTKKEKTIVRPNRRGIEGLKGHKKFKNEINVLLDTSGSMGGEFEKVLSYIFQNDIHINLIQCDAAIQQTLKIKDKKELERMRIKGLGGTTLQPGLDFISEKKNKISMFNTVILTDGYTDSLNFKNIKGKTLILSTATACPVSHDNGRVKQILGIGKQD